MAPAGQVILLGYWPSSYSMRVRLALSLQGVEYEYREEDFSAKSTLLLESNPVHGKIPVLIHGGRPVCESLVIVEYIDEVWGGNDAEGGGKSRFLPSDPYHRARARFWADFVDKKVYPLGFKVWKCKGGEREKVKEEFLGCMRLLEEELEQKTFFGGEALGFVDISLLPFASCWVYTVEKFVHFSFREECPKLMAWVERCRRTKNIAEALPDPQKIYEEFVCEYARKNGITVE